MIKSRDFPLRCPEYKCQMEINIQDIQEAIPKEQTEQFWKNSLNNYLNGHQQEISYCPTPDCPYAFIFDDNDSQFACPICKKKYCLNCRVEFHAGLTCKEYQLSHNKSKEDQEFEEFAKGKKYKQCPKCKFWVEKTSGCNHMKCRCNFEFCYKCGKEYRAQCFGNCHDLNEVTDILAIGRNDAGNEIVQFAAGLILQVGIEVIGQILLRVIF